MFAHQQRGLWFVPGILAGSSRGSKPFPTPYRRSLGKRHQNFPIFFGIFVDLVSKFELFGLVALLLGSCPEPSNVVFCCQAQTWANFENLADNWWRWRPFNQKTNTHNHRHRDQHQNLTCYMLHNMLDPHQQKQTNQHQHQHINISTYQPINISTCQHSHVTCNMLQTHQQEQPNQHQHQHINIDTSTWTNQHQRININTSSQQRVKTFTHQHINTPTHLNASTHQHLNTSTPTHSHTHQN